MMMKRGKFWTAALAGLLALGSPSAAAENELLERALVRAAGLAGARPDGAAVPDPTVGAGPLSTTPSVFGPTERPVRVETIEAGVRGCVGHAVGMPSQRPMPLFWEIAVKAYGEDALKAVPAKQVAVSVDTKFEQGEITWFGRFFLRETRIAGLGSDGRLRINRAFNEDALGVDLAVEGLPLLQYRDRTSAPIYDQWGRRSGEEAYYHGLTVVLPKGPSTVIFANRETKQPSRIGIAPASLAECLWEVVR